MRCERRCKTDICRIDSGSCSNWPKAHTSWQMTINKTQHQAGGCCVFRVPGQEGAHHRPVPACCLLQAIENACRQMDGPPESETERASVGFVLKVRVCRVHGNRLITFRVLSHGGVFLSFLFFTDHIGKACRTRFRHVSEYLLAFLFLMPL